MTAIRLDMTMSLDGFAAGPDDRPGQEMGQGGFRLFNWLDDRDGPGPKRRGAARALIRAGELDEIEVHVVPVLLGKVAPA